jgi:hypothetical protein
MSISTDINVMIHHHMRQHTDIDISTGGIRLNMTTSLVSTLSVVGWVTILLMAFITRKLTVAGIPVMISTGTGMNIERMFFLGSYTKNIVIKKG